MPNGEAKAPKSRPKIVVVSDHATALWKKSRDLQTKVIALQTRLFGSELKSEEDRAETPTAQGVIDRIAQSICATTLIINEATSQVQYLLDQTVE